MELVKYLLVKVMELCKSICAKWTSRRCFERSEP